MAVKSVTSDDLSASVQAKAAAKSTPSQSGSPEPAVQAEPTEPKGLRKQFEELLAEKKQLEEFAQSEYELRVRAEALRSAPPAQAVPPEPKDAAPDPDDVKYASDPKAFLADRDAWNRREALREFSKQQEEQKKASEQAKQAAEFESRRTLSLAAARESFPDFDDAIKSADVRARMGQVPAPPAHIQEALAESEYMAHLLYHFATNPEEAKKIFDMPRGRASLALGRLETKFEKQSEAPVKAAPKAVSPPPVSKAPAPLPSLSGGEGVIATSSAEATSFHDYKRLRMEEMKRRGRR